MVLVDEILSFLDEKHLEIEDSCADNFSDPSLDPVSILMFKLWFSLHVLLNIMMV